MPLLSSLDAARRMVLASLAPWLGGFYGDRGRRIAWGGTLGIALALALSVRFPLALLALGPLVLGVPHLLSDVRYLVVRPGAHRRPLLFVFVWLPLAATWLFPRLEVGLLALVGAALVARTRPLSKGVGLVVASTIYAIAWFLPGSFSLAFAHAHNFVAAIVLLCFSRSIRRALVPTLAFALLSGLTLSGAFDPWLEFAAASALPGGADLPNAIRQYAPFCSSDAVATRVVVLFVFAQSVHYTIWLRLLPDEARSRKGLTSFTRSFLTLQKDFGRLALSVFVLASLVFCIWGASSPEPARIGYLRFAGFHGYLELAFLALVLLEGRPQWIPSLRTTDAKGQLA